MAPRALLAYVPALLVLGCGASSGSAPGAQAEPSRGGDEIAGARDISSPATPELCRETTLNTENAEESLVEEIQEREFDEGGRLIRRSQQFQGGEMSDVRLSYAPDGSYTRDDEEFFVYEVTEQGDTITVAKFDADPDSGRIEVERDVFRYGVDGRVLEVRRITEGLTFGALCEYDGAGRVTRVRDYEDEPSSSMGSSTYRYDDDGHLSAIESSEADEAFRTTVVPGVEGIELAITLFDVDADEEEHAFDGPPYRRVTLAAHCLALRMGRCSPMLAPSPPGGAPRYVLPL